MSEHELRDFFNRDAEHAPRGFVTRMMNFCSGAYDAQRRNNPIATVEQLRKHVTSYMIGVGNKSEKHLRHLFVLLDDELNAPILLGVCRWCGEAHDGRRCPLVKAFEFYPDGKIKRVEFVEIARIGVVRSEAAA